MPNHVSSDLYVTGRIETIDKFMDFAINIDPCLPSDDQLLDANKFIPYPEHFKKLDALAKIAAAKEPPDYTVKDGFNSGGFQWCLENWGTKWGIYDCKIEYKDFGIRNGKLKYRFNTAWAPPLPIIKAMSDKFPTLRFRLNYFEFGMGFKGTYIVKNGEVIKDVQSKYSGRRGG